MKPKHCHRRVYDWVLLGNVSFLRDSLEGICVCTRCLSLAGLAASLIFFLHLFLLLFLIG